MYVVLALLPTCRQSRTDESHVNTLFSCLIQIQICAWGTLPLMVQMAASCLTIQAELHLHHKWATSMSTLPQSVLFELWRHSSLFFPPCSLAGTSRLVLNQLHIRASRSCQTPCLTWPWHMEARWRPRARKWWTKM